MPARGGLRNDTFEYWVEKSAGTKATVRNAPSNGTTITPRRFDGLEFAKTEWKKAPWPPKAEPPAGWPAGKWPPKSLVTLLAADNGKDLHCLGRSLWDDNMCSAGRGNLNCGHKFQEWLSGGLDWTSRFELRDTPLGVAAFTKTKWKRGQILGAYTGRVIPVPDEQKSLAYCLNIPIGKRASKRAKNRHDMTWPKAMIDAESKGNWTRFINHNCDANTHYEYFRVGKQIAMVIEATRTIEAGAEVTADYGEGYFKQAGYGCRCWSKNCMSKRFPTRVVERRRSLSPKGVVKRTRRGGSRVRSRSGSPVKRRRSENDGRPVKVTFV
ncbi:SET domain-containing protein [Lophium mytilinum]|uniref:SET domain-containing protein n=1 Tax=Lophium mytilinum TaxID=390894 RepID=A0A6A6R406_9PEZI|nr:SET domain-containing protein [Lophium mytilinum]